MFCFCLYNSFQSVFVKGLTDLFVTTRKITLSATSKVWNATLSQTQVSMHYVHFVKLLLYLSMIDISLFFYSNEPYNPSAYKRYEGCEFSMFLVEYFVTFGISSFYWEILGIHLNDIFYLFNTDNKYFIFSLVSQPFLFLIFFRCCQRLQIFKTCLQDYQKFFFF